MQTLLGKVDRRLYYDWQEFKKTATVGSKQNTTFIAAFLICLMQSQYKPSNLSHTARLSGTSYT